MFYILIHFSYQYFAPAMVMKPSLSTFLSEKGIPGSLFVTGEVMFVLRPLIYVLLVRKYGARSWFPWVISLAVDVIGNGILSCINLCPQKNKSQQFQLSNSEKDEVRIIFHFEIFYI